MKINMYSKARGEPIPGTDTGRAKEAKVQELTRDASRSWDREMTYPMPVR